MLVPGAVLCGFPVLFPTRVFLISDSPAAAIVGLG